MNNDNIRTAMPNIKFRFKKKRIFDTFYQEINPRELKAKLRFASISPYGLQTRTKYRLLALNQRIYVHYAKQGKHDQDEGGD